MELLTVKTADYVITNGVRGDDCYQYYVVYNKEKRIWEISYGDIPYTNKTKNNLKNLQPIVCQKCFNETKADIENRYWCEECDNTMIVSLEDEFEFKINSEYCNIVFKINEKTDKG